MDEDFLDLIDQAFLEGQIDGKTMELACLWSLGSGRKIPAAIGDTLMNDNNHSEHKKALRDANKRFRITTDNYFKLLARINDAGESNTIPASYNDEWCNICAELQEAEIALNKIVGSILGSR